MIIVIFGFTLDAAMCNAYVNCFYDLQEPCIPHQSLTRQQIYSQDLNFETEAWLKL